MTSVAFIGLGAMGGPMAANLVAAGRTVVGYDADPVITAHAAESGVRPAQSAMDAVAGADFVITMLPNGRIVEDLLLRVD